MSWHPLLLSLRATAVATLLMVAVGLPLALLFARRQFPGKTVAETLVNLPLVLPPTVVGYYLLLVLGRGGPLVEWLDVRLLFTWGAVVIASAIVGLPLMVGAARAAIAEVDPALENARAPSVRRSWKSCGASPCRWRGAGSWPGWCWAPRARWASSARR